MKTYSYVIFVVRLAFLIVACETTSTSSGDSPKTISGTVTVPDSLKNFVIIVAGTPDSLSVYASEDLVSGIWGGESPYIMLVKTSTPAGDNSRSYSLDLADDPETFGLVIAFVDRNGNGKLDYPEEEARLPEKNIEGADEVIWSWGYITVGDNSQYLVAYGMGNNVGLDIVGRMGLILGFDERYRIEKTS